jgi:hypothetical protein
LIRTSRWVTPFFSASSSVAIASRGRPVRQ